MAFNTPQLMLMYDKAEKRGRILNSLPAETQRVWEEYCKLPRPIYFQYEIEIKIIVLLGCITIFFTQGKWINRKEVRRFYLESIKNSNKKFEEFSQKNEIKEILTLFEQNDVAWNK